VTASFVLYVEDVDSAFKKAVGAGAKELQPVEDKFYGDRMGTLADPFGHQWSLGTHIEDVSPEEMQKRSQAAMAQMSS
jgi:PhnB protein